MRLNRISVLLLWGLFDNELHVEFEGEWTGPYYPISGPTLLNVV
ncbi:phage integrase family site specific recombinase [Yersinia pseudotuberculosis]|nr:site-specific recombinase, phage integrase family [Yersinia pseudotuberculosis]CNE72773.1 phage integrase family site specific recombinase [Yersinia pseudotuberculosis]CQH53041.1 phage integrase family site specific recombinase [Yersinia pseudotuberculosis]